MRERLSLRSAGLLLGITSLLMLMAAGMPKATPTASDTAPAFLQAGHCYRFTFSTAGAPNWKVLELLDHGWIKAEIDAGPSSARREAVWVNTAQILTAREARCSD